MRQTEALIYEVTYDSTDGKREQCLFATIADGADGIVKTVQEAQNWLDSQFHDATVLGIVLLPKMGVVLQPA